MAISADTIIGALTVRIGFGVYYTISIIRSTKIVYVTFKAPILHLESWFSQLRGQSACLFLVVQQCSVLMTE